MIEIELIDVSGFEGAIRGMRHPYKSYEKSDSCEELLEPACTLDDWANCELAKDIPISNVEVNLNYIKFTYEGVEIKVRLADGHVFMEYEPEEIEE